MSTSTSATGTPARRTAAPPRYLLDATSATDVIDQPQQHADEHVDHDDDRPRGSRVARWVTGRDLDQPRWVRPSALALLLGTGLLYFWNLTISGYGNSFYAAAIQAGTKSWTALLFGSLDAGNAITVDKPPASLWLPALLGRLFGFNSFTVLAPQALMGVAAVGLLYAAVKRTNGPAAGLIAGAGLALTPVATLMFRFDNPDALLTLCLVAAGYAVIRAVEKHGARWLLLAGALLGLAFLTKMLQGFLTIPALALAYLWAANTGIGRRLLNLLAALGGILVVAGSYLLVFQLTPADQRPYMAGTETNSFLELTFGYNGLGRIFGGSGNGGGGGGMGGNGNTGFGGSTGLLRMFNSAFGAEVSWLLPAAAILLVAGLWFTRRAPRTDLTRASLILWGGWMIITAGIFSFMEGTIHPYYAVALAPAIAALVGIGSVELWRGRAYLAPRIVLAVSILATTVWSFALLSTASSWLPWLKWVQLVLGALTATALVFRLDAVRRMGVAVILAALLSSGLGMGSWAIATAASAHSGSIPTSGPVSAGGGMGGMGGMGGAPGQTGTTPGGTTGQNGTTGQAPTGQTPGGTTDSTTGQAPGGMGGEAGGANAELTALLQKTTTTWSAAISGATGAADLELASDTSVIALGGWNGSDPSPTLAQFQQMVRDGKISYFISGGGMGGGGGQGGGSSSSSEIATWVAANYTATTVGSSTVYDLRS
ncbi:glycosyltransferase family 39 protein [Tersicoccus sp. Bi-70]|uniref:glycosyltransferase family 39 protein n=1 Tax=Tersicoccus sp. Bi-70 TaxID=1897634 RepID=UPI0009FB73A8|nr:glycosyltransferase family 39 protein [Tersicoccus sp. Bi-70]